MEKFLLNNEVGKIAFVEKITSNVTHEINNILSIINEYTGIIDDKIYAFENTGNLDIEKIKLYKEKIYTQISRGKRINKLLNEFSHSIDNEFKAVEINLEIKKFLELIERIAKINETQFVFEQNISLEIRINLFEFYRVFFKFLYILSKNVIPKSQITILNDSKSVTIISKLENIENFNAEFNVFKQHNEAIFERNSIEVDKDEIKVEINLEVFQ